MAPSAYMVFCNGHREETKQSLAQAGDGKVSVTVVAKALGERWKALSAEERQAYKDQAAALAAEQSANQGDEAAGPPGEGAAADQAAAPAAAIPVSWVRKLVLADEDVARCSADAAQALAGVAEVFLESLCRKAVAVSQRHKRRTVKLEDYDAVVRGDKRLSVAVGLKDICAVLSEQHEQQEAQQQQQQQQPGGDCDDGAKRCPQRAPKESKKPKLAANRIDRFFAVC